MPAAIARPDPPSPTAAIDEYDADADPAPF
jgi:hypothetical protein